MGLLLARKPSFSAFKVQGISEIMAREKPTPPWWKRIWKG